MTEPALPGGGMDAGRARRRTGLEVGIAFLVGGGALILYLRTLAPTVLAGDPGELQLASYLAGVAHPTGYPLYLLLGWAWSHLLPIGDPAYRMNLFSAIWAASAVGLFYLMVAAWLQQALPDLAPLLRRAVAALAAAFLAVTPTLWSQAIIAEVYSLHLFFVILLFDLLLVRRLTGSFRAWLPVIGCFGLSLAHHRTMLLLAPAIGVFWVVGGRGTGVQSSDPSAISNLKLTPRGGRGQGALPASCFRYPASFLLPLLLYLYIPLRAPHTPYLHLPLSGAQELILYDNTPAGFVRFILGGPFGGSVDLTVDLGARLAMAGGLLRDEVGWIGIGLALIGLARLILSRRWALLALSGLTYVSVVAFNLVYTIGDIFVLFIPSYAIVVLWMAVGTGWLLQIFRAARLPLFLASAFFALPVWMAAGHFADLDQSHNTAARTRWEAILAGSPPQGAVLVSNDRNDMMPLWYLQYVEHRRPDLLGLFPLITPDHPTLGHILDLALSTGRPVYLIKEMPGVEVKVAVAGSPEGGLWQVIGPAAGEPTCPLAIHLGEAVALRGYDCLPGAAHPGDTLPISLYWEALHPLEAEYHTFVHLLDATGQKVAQSDRQPGGVYYPTMLWRPGERLRDDHRLEIPAEVPAGVYHLLAGMYAFAGDGSLIPLGEPVVVGQVVIEGRADLSAPLSFRR